MLRINQIKISPKDFFENQEEIIKQKIGKILHISPLHIKNYQIVKQSVDARKKPIINYILSLDVEVLQESKILKRNKDKNVSLSPKLQYTFKSIGLTPLKKPPVIIGAGPAGLFCAYELAKNGYCPIVLERGDSVEERKIQVSEFWETGNLNLQSNVQFGEGGAGTFSDGKLNTLVKDKYGRNKEVLEIFVKAGASQRILYENKPHIGTDVLLDVVKNIREQIKNWGGKFYFRSEVTKLLIEEHELVGVEINHKEYLDGNAFVFAIGHSARDTMEMLYESGIPMESKSFAVGLRVEHPQTMINLSQYGMEFPEFLDAASYKVTAQSNSQRGVYSFCMCPGGYVVNASSENERLAVNGMSYSKRDGKNANSAIVVTVTPKDFKENGPLAGIQFQRELEEKAFQIGKGRIPIQYFKDFKENRSSKEYETWNKPTMCGSYTYSNVRKILPEELNQAIIDGMHEFGKIIKGFDRDDALLSGVESRTSSPVRIHRDENLQSMIKGFYPCGEGAGYAGGITSAAMDGIKVAEQIASYYKPLKGENCE